MPTPLAIAVACVFAQVALTLFAIVRMGLARVGAIRADHIPLSEAAKGNDIYPDDIRRLGDNARNQFETPPLLYGGVALGAALGAVNWGVAVGAIAYILTRLGHRREHVGRNHLRVRFQWFVASVLALGFLWLSLGIGLIL